MEPPIWESFDPTRRIGSRVRCYENVTSTMDVAQALADAGAREGEAVLALRQSQGRGRFGRPWVAEPGDALLLSVVLRPRISDMGLLGPAAALATFHAVRELAGFACSVKWPNDLLLYGRKIAGILVEGRVDTDGNAVAVVGIGLNLNLDPTAHRDIERTATSVQDVTGHEADLEEYLDLVLARYESAYRAVQRGDDVIAEWRKLLETLGKRVRVKQRGRLIVGLAEDVDEDGHLILRTDDGNRHLLAEGDVTLAAR